MSWAKSFRLVSGVLNEYVSATRLYSPERSAAVTISCNRSATAAGTFGGAGHDIAQALTNPQVQARNMVVQAEDPVLGPVGLVGNPLKMSAFEDPPTRRITPDLDQDRARLLAEFGLVGPDPSERPQSPATGR